LELSTDLQEKYSEEAPHWDSRDLLRYNDQLVEMERNLKLVQQPKIYLESVMLKLVELDPSVSLDDLITRLSGSASKLSSANNPRPTQTFEKVESKSDPAPVVKEKYSEDKNNEADENPKNEEETEEENSNISLDYVKEKWDDLISKVGENGTSLSTFLSHGKPTRLKGKKLFITIPRKYRFQTDVLKKNSRKLEITFEKELGVDLRMNFILSEKKDSEQDDITKHPVTQRMVDLFGGEIYK
jgi:DNA polymerase III gamma/tau subunit